MATVQAKQLQSRLTQGYSLRDGFNEVDAEVTTTYFNRDTTDAANGNLAQNDVVQVAILPKGARLKGGRLAWSALGTNVTLSVGLAPYSSSSGTAAAPTALLGSTAAATAGQADFGNTIALKYGDVLAEPMYLIVTVGGANPAGSQGFRGFVDFLAK